MDGASELTEGRLQEIVEHCLRLALPEGAPLPANDEDWIAGGALDSMGHVDVLLCIEKAVGLKDFFDRLEGRPPTTIRAVIDGVRKVFATRQLARARRARLRSLVGDSLWVEGSSWRRR